MEDKQEHDHEGRPIGKRKFVRPAFNDELYQIHEALNHHALMEGSYCICECGIELNYDNKTEKQIRAKAFGHERWRFRSSEWERYKIQVNKKESSS